MPRNGPVQWGWGDMEELLQCPVCLDIPAIGVVEQCQHGHHICRHCKSKVETCPLCKSEFFGTRNFVVEELIRNLHILKNTMQLSNLITESKDNDQAVAAANRDEAVVAVKLPRKGHLTTPAANKGTYPCRFHDCDAVLPIARLLNHVRSMHAEHLIEGAVDYTDTYSHTYEFRLKNEKPINRQTFITFVSGIGLVFLNFELLRTGELIVYTQMAMKFMQARNFVATIDLLSDNRSLSYCTRMISLRDNPVGIMKRRCCYVVDRNNLKRLRVRGGFTCKLMLAGYNSGFESCLTAPNTDLITFATNNREHLGELESTALAKKGVTTTGGESKANVHAIVSNPNNVVVVNSPTPLESSSSVAGAPAAVPRTTKKSKTVNHVTADNLENLISPSTSQLQQPQSQTAPQGGPTEAAPQQKKKKKGKKKN